MPSSICVPLCVILNHKMIKFRNFIVRRSEHIGGKDAADTPSASSGQAAATTENQADRQPFDCGADVPIRLKNGFTYLSLSEG